MKKLIALFLPLLFLTACSTPMSESMRNAKEVHFVFGSKSCAPDKFRLNADKYTQSEPKQRMLEYVCVNDRERLLRRQPIADKIYTSSDFKALEMQDGVHVAYMPR